MQNGDDQTCDQEDGEQPAPPSCAERFTGLLRFLRHPGLTPRRAIAIRQATPVSLASSRGSMPAALNEAAHRSSVGVSNRMPSSAYEANQPCLVISSSS